VGDYDAVLQSSEQHHTADGTFRTLTLDALIMAKQAVAREKDFPAIKLLQAVKERIASDKQLKLGL